VYGMCVCVVRQNKRRKLLVVVTRHVGIRIVEGGRLGMCAVCLCIGVYMGGRNEGVAPVVRAAVRQIEDWAARPMGEKHRDVLAGEGERVRVAERAPYLWW
jgi:hypothetical protein